MIRAAIVGNPNVGKTELFNRLTGLRQHVGNWPGVTVEKKWGRCVYDGEEIEIVDLPGVYSLTADSMDEVIARDFIVHEKPDVVIDIVDGASLERNLYLTVLLVELGANVVLALNQWDVVKKRGLHIDVAKLSHALGMAVIPTVAPTGEGVERLKEAVAHAAKKGASAHKPSFQYGHDLEASIESVEAAIRENGDLAGRYSPRWLAIGLLESDDEAMKVLEASPHKAEILTAVEKAVNALGKDPEGLLAERRYGVIRRILDVAVGKMEKRWTYTDLLDRVFLHRALGIPVFLALLYAAFQFTFSFSAPFSDMIGVFFAWISSFVAEGISNPVLASFLSDGVLGGLGSVLVFIPPIFTLFFALAILEDSGYLARAAFVMDRAMYKLGLHGRSFIPMIIGFGCNIPGIMATRTIENENDRIITILVNPLMSCSARLPVYVLISGAIFGTTYLAGAAVYSMYILGVALAVVSAVIFRRTLFKGKPSHFVLELPSYRMPRPKSVVIHMWERGRWFLIKAGTFIFAVVVLVWFLSVFPWGATSGGELVENSYIAAFGRAIEPIFRPFGWNWQSAVALFFGFLAKEAVVGTFGTLLGSGQEGVQQALVRANWFTPISGFAYMAFVLIYFPCVATIGVMLRELRLKWALFAPLYTIVLAFMVSGIIVGLGTLLGLL